MKLIFLHGPPASGKLTVGRALQSLTGFALFHNHLVVDALLAVFPFGSPSFIHLREQIWLSVFQAAARDNLSLIFTFAPETTVNHGFIQSTIASVQASAGQVCFVELTCPDTVIEQRLEETSRHAFHKLTDVPTLRELTRSGALDFPPLPSSGLTIDTSRVQPAEAAHTIAAHFHLPVAGYDEKPIL